MKHQKKYSVYSMWYSLAPAPTKIDLIFWTKAFIGIGSNQCLLYEETSRIDYSGVIFVHSSTQSSNLEGSLGLFYAL